MAASQDPPIHAATSVHALLDRLVHGDELAMAEARWLFERLLAGELDPAQIGALLALLQRRGPSPNELAGAAQAMRAAVEPVPFKPAPDEALIDTCGTGGAMKTFNVSTAAALVAAAATPDPASGIARVLVAKHGNRSRTGRGSAEVLAALGVNVDAPPPVQAACLREVGLCFCFAIHHHPAMRHASGPRAALGFPTLFNLLGPLTNPAAADRQLIGVYRNDLVDVVARALALLGARRAMVAHSLDGLDELSVAAPARVAIVDQGRLSTMAIDPDRLGLSPATPQSLAAHDVPSAAAAIHGVLEGRPGPRRDMVRLNAAAALYVASAAPSIESGLRLAAEAIDSGRARAALAALADRSHAAP